MGLAGLLLSFCVYTFFLPSRCLTSLEASSVKVLLNLASVNTSHVSIFEGSEGDAKFRSFTAKDGHWITSVYDDQKEIFKAPDGKRCVLVVVYSRGDSVLLAVDVKDADIVYFEKADELKWFRITEDAFEGKLTNMKSGKVLPNKLDDVSLVTDGATDPSDGQNEVPLPSTETELEELKKGLPIPTILEISKTDNNHVLVEESSKDNVIHTSFKIEKGFVVTKVVDNGKTIWIGDMNNTCQGLDLDLVNDWKLLNISLKVVGGKARKYFENNGGGWEKVSRYKYQKRLDEESKAVDGPAREPVVPSSPGILDIAKPDKSKVYVIRDNINGTNQKNIYPTNGSVLTSLVDSGRTIWEAQDGEKLGSVTIHSLNGASILTVALKHGANKEFKYFEKVDGYWNGITGREHRDKLDEMLYSKTDEGEDNATQITKVVEKVQEAKKPKVPIIRSRKLSLLTIGRRILEASGGKYLDFKTPIELNLGDQLVDDKVDVHEVTLNNLSHKFYLPKDGYYFTKVKDGGQTVSIEPDSKCILAYIFHRSEPVLLLHSIGLYGGEKFKFMVKNGGKWEEPEYALRMKLEHERENIANDIVQSAFGDD